MELGRASILYEVVVFVVSPIIETSMGGFCSQVLVVVSAVLWPATAEHALVYRYEESISTEFGRTAGWLIRAQKISVLSM